MGQARVHAPGPVGRTGHFRYRDTGRTRQALAPELRITTHGWPTTFHVFDVGFFKAFRRGHHTVFETTAFLITGTVQGSQFVFRELGAFFQKSIQQFAIDIVQTQAGVVAIQIQHFIEYKAHIAQGSLVIRHLKSPLNYR